MATATLISYPSALCLAGNISPVMVSAAGLFTFRLKKGSTVLLEEDYVPDASGQAEIDIRDLVLSDLSLSLPSADVFKQTAAAASYTISTDTDSRTFKAVLGGIDRPATDAATFLGANFLTWQPQLKSVTYGQPEWLSFYTPATAVSLKAKFYLKDGTTSTVTVAASFDPGCVYSVNVRFSRLWGMGEGDRYGMVDVWLEDDQSTALTYVQRYVLEHSRLGIPVLFSSESPHGHQALDGYLLPVNLACGCCFAPELLEEAAAVCGRQLQAMGIDLALVSALDVLRDPRWGRSEECFGEDPYLASQMAAAVVRGYQSQGVDVVAKHLCAQGETTGGVNASAARIGPRELREIHLPPVRVLTSTNNSHSRASR